MLFMSEYFSIPFERMIILDSIFFIVILVITARMSSKIDIMTFFRKLFFRLNSLGKVTLESHAKYRLINLDELIMNI